MYSRNVAMFSCGGMCRSVSIYRLTSAMAKSTLPLAREIKYFFSIIFTTKDIPGRAPGGS